MIDNASLLSRSLAAVPRGVGTAAPIFIDRALNAEMWDVEGRRYIDFAAGIAVLNVGHCHPRIMAAVQAQLERFTHLAFQVTGYDNYIALTERLNALAPFAGPAKTILFTTGAEAVENATKIARIATGRPAIIAFTGAFHGRTHLTSTLTGKVSPYKAQHTPQAPEVHHIPFPAPHLGVSVEDSLKALSFLFLAQANPSRIAAIIVEPVQGEGGFNIASVEFMQKLRAICDAHGILLIADEVQTGFARTGKMFGIEHCGVEPDLITVAKALGGGFPLSGVIGRTAIMDTVNPGGLGGTYGGSPVACAAALAVLDVIADERLVERAGEIGARMQARIATMAHRNDVPPISALRGLGAMVAFDLVDADGKPDGATARQVTTRALAEGLIVLNAGMHGETVRILSPLTASGTIIEEGLDCLERALIATGASSVRSADAADVTVHSALAAKI